MWIERHTEGDRSAHMRRDQASWTVEKFGRKAAKQALWIAVGWWTGFTFVGYFTPIHVLAGEIAQFSLGSWEVFWVFFYGFATYGNAGYMREQVCKHMCPYARFQSAMFDHDTLIVTYDDKRGEPRGSRSRHVALSDTGLGACVDCDLCVHVCPTGIDIRQGLQYECIGCAACVDVCDGVMEKMGYDKGLIRYATQNAMQNGWTTAVMWRRILRPRVLIYTGVLWTLILLLAFSLFLRMPMKVDVIRDRGLPRITQLGEVENVYRLQVMNATEEAQGLHIQVRGLDGMDIHTNDEMRVDAAQSRWIPVRVAVPFDMQSPGSHPIWFDISNDDGSLHVTEQAVFLVPR